MLPVLYSDGVVQCSRLQCSRQLKVSPRHHMQNLALAYEGLFELRELVMEPEVLGEVFVEAPFGWVVMALLAPFGMVEQETLEFVFVLGLRARN